MTEQMMQGPCNAWFDEKTGAIYAKTADGLFAGNAYQPWEIIKKHGGEREQLEKDREVLALMVDGLRDYCRRISPDGTSPVISVPLQASTWVLERITR